MIELLKETNMSTKEFITRAMDLKDALVQLPDARLGDAAYPLEHFFADGIYIRQMTGTKGEVVVTKLHKTDHPYFVLKGDVSIYTEEGMVRIKAPHWGITKAGTIRVGYFHEDTIWITVHATKETDLAKIESEVIAATYNELPDSIKETPLLEI